MTNRDINHILAGFDRSKATAYDKDYADRLYREYQNRAIDDTAALDTLRTAFGGKTVLVLAPGASLAEETGRNAVAAAKADCIVSANFCPEFCQPDYAFLPTASGLKSWTLLACPALLCSPPTCGRCRRGRWRSIMTGWAAPDVQNASLGSNSVLMLLRLLRLCGAKAVLLAGPMATSPVPLPMPTACCTLTPARSCVQHRHGRCHQSLRAGCDLYHPKRIRKITRFAHDSTFGSGCRRHHDRRRRVL
mgnify:CR=1 FL=1